MTLGVIYIMGRGYLLLHTTSCMAILLWITI